MNVQLAERVLARMSKVFPDAQQAITSATVLLGNIYASLGEKEKSSTLRLELTRSGAKKVVGASWTAPDGELAVRVLRMSMEMINVLLSSVVEISCS